MKQAADLRLRVQLYSIAGITSPGFQKLAGPALEGAVVSHWEARRGGSAYESFRARFKAANGKDPILDFVAAPTFDAASLALRTRRVVQRPVTAAARRGDLLGGPPFDGVSGPIEFDPDGAVRSIRERLFRFEKGRLIPIDR